MVREILRDEWQQIWFKCPITPSSKGMLKQAYVLGQALILPPVGTN